ncbi:hypothetical protein [Desulfosarcina variabilis]|uniref:hypothetical protein n=1 Tax=Desulfosarcina variabilis TaxID=2300 RepID=UPI003AFA59DF
MKSKKRNRNKNKRKKQSVKTLKTSLSKQKKMNQIAFTATGEIFQPVRIHYTVDDVLKLNDVFSKLKCMEYDSDHKRWVWLYTGEARKLEFEHDPGGENIVIIGEFIFENSKNIVLNLRSHERAIYGIAFFDEHIPKSVAEVTDITTINRLFSLKEAASVSTLNQLFETGNLTIRDPEKITQDLLKIKSGNDDESEKKKEISEYILELSNEKTPEIEKFPSNYYEDGIESLEFSLRLNQIVAFQHWKGNTNYTAMDAIREGVKKSTISI